jgi:4'-phosphopantetheinyl transferase
MILARYLRTAPELVNLAAGPNGKPRLIHPFMDLRFNVSHSHDLALIGITLGREIGVDVERVQQEILFEEIAAHYFEPTEVWELRTMPPEERVWKFFDFWTRKEACLKASGRGLDGLGKPDENQWGVRGFSPAAGYAGAVASHGDDWRLACWDWSL